MPSRISGTVNIVPPILYAIPSVVGASLLSSPCGLHTTNQFQPSNLIVPLAFIQLIQRKEITF